MEQQQAYGKNALLMERYQNGDEDAEAALVEENMGLVRSVAHRFLNRGTEYEDLIQIGILGMLKAIRSFSPTRGCAFSTYAVPVIIGEIRRHLRDDGPIKVSRIYKREGTALLRERQRILTEEGREAGIAELAELCAISPEEAAVALEAVSPVTSMSDLVVGEESLTLEGVLADEESLGEYERICDRIALAQCIRRLPPLWQRIVLLRYYRGMTQQETAELLGLTQVKVSREEKKLLADLRRALS